MKIHKVAIENLNSLYGHHEIDFDSDLDQAPLFLIVGPTGAGKSTIMDAISLALFGMTPRLSGGHGQEDTDSRMIMSRGTGRCSAEVVFSKQVPGAPRTFFRARWEAWRSRDKPDGAFQTARRSLIQEDSLGLEAQVLANDTKRKIWAPAFQAVLEGMEPAEFQRSMLLAQGQFAAFLRASVAERAQILERLTSTEQYRVIGARAMERHRLAKSEVDKLRAGVGAIEILDAAQLEELARTVDLTKAATMASENRHRRARMLLEWARRDAGLKNDLADATERLTKERRRWDAQTPQRERLAESNRCADAGEVLRRAKSLDRDRMQLSGAIEDALEAHESLSATLADSTTEVERLQEEHEARRRALADAAPRLALAAEARDANRRVAADAQTLAAEVEALAALRARVEPVREELDGLKVAAAADAEADSLVADRVRTTQEALADLCGERTAAEHGIWLAEERDRLAETARRLEALRQQLDDLDSASGAQQMALEALEALRQETKQLELNRDQGQSAKVEAAEHRATARKLVETTARVIELEERRDALSKGEECPLCGSTTHPFAVDPSSDEKAHAAHADAEAALAKASKALDDALEAASSSAAELSAHLARLEASEEAAEKENVRVAALSARIVETGGADGITDRQSLDRVVAALTPQRGSLDGSTRDFTSAEANARAAVAEAEALRTRRADAERKRIAAEASLQAMEETLRLREDGRDDAQKRLVDSQVAAIGALAALGQRVPEDASTDELERLLLDAFDGKTAEEARAALERSAADAQRAREEAAKTLATQREAIAAVDATLADRKQSLERIQAKLKAATAELESAIQTLGFSDASELEARVLTATERDLLQRNVDDVRSRFEQATGRADALAQQLSEHREAQPDGLVDGQPFEALEMEDREAAAALETGRQEVARLGARLEEQERARSRRTELIEELDAAEKDAVLWNEMRLLIGSNEGGAFQRFAQTLNLSELIARANVRLKELEPRYELVVAKDSHGNPELAFAVRDHEHGGRVRPQTTLSGGETFLVSLALALALSEYRQTQMPIETLLLDEGFGTLDAETLDIAMSALERLCATGGTQIGVISHVEGLRERINAQILVEKLGGGRSRLKTTL